MLPSFTSSSASSARRAGSLGAGSAALSRSSWSIRRVGASAATPAKVTDWRAARERKAIWASLAQAAARSVSSVM